MGKKIPSLSIKLSIKILGVEAGKLNTKVNASFSIFLLLKIIFIFKKTNKIKYNKINNK